MDLVGYAQNAELSMTTRNKRTAVGWKWDNDKWERIYKASTPKAREKKNKSLLKEIDNMLESARIKSGDKQTYTVCCNKLHNNLPGACVYILRGKKKLKSKKDKSKKPCKICFSHYVDTKYYVATMMVKDFEMMYSIIIKPGRYRYMTCDIKFSKNKKTKKSK